jgi:hypothetical protein
MIPMPTLRLVLPILPGKVEAWRRFCQELQGVRRADYQASCQRRGVVAEEFILVQTPAGEAVRIRIEATDVGQDLADLAASPDPFDCWYKDKLNELHSFQLTDKGG